MKKLLVFAGWAISGFFLVIALVSLFSPGSTKLTLGIIVWGLTFFPPLWKKTMTIEYGVIANIAMRIVAAIVAPFVGYLITPGDVPEKAQVAVVSKQPVKTIEKVTPEPAKIVVTKPEQVAKTVEPKITQCELDILVVRDINRMRDANSSVKSLINGENIHRNIYPAFKSCGSIDEFVAEASKYPESTNKSNPKVYLANICSTSETLEMGICKEVPNYPGMKTVHYLELKEYSDTPTPVSDKETIQDLFDATRANDKERYISIARNRQISVVKDEPVDVLNRDGDLAQVRLHALDIEGKDLEGKVLWTYAKAVRTNYEYVK